jgi:hypothetical protein
MVPVMVTDVLPGPAEDGDTETTVGVRESSNANEQSPRHDPMTLLVKTWATAAETPSGKVGSAFGGQ